MSTKTENILDPNSCWNRAESEEPVFILRANDDVAPANVILWAQQYLSSKGGLRNMNHTQVAKYENALQIARQMREWRHTKLFGKPGSGNHEDDIPF